ncbi:PilW family protein [Limnohabitans sp.]|uniref:PilW family protein n=1 Tax=Limnohabitans sp. TaxID=1907725 RepID=UPI00286EF563|nr:PilW family protein [Limnohabitans sp.]
MTTLLPQRGLTLPELLLGLGLGLLVTAAGLSAYGSSQQTWAAMAAADAVHANARMALHTVREQAHLAGGVYLSASNSSEGGITVDLSPTEEAGQAALAGVEGSKYVESLRLGHWHAFDALDCQGNTSSTQATVSNHYKLNTNKELTCKDLNLSGSTYQALAEGVEDFQLRYAEANPSSQTMQWKTADQVSAMSQVMAIEVCLRVASINTVHNAKPNADQTGCQGEALAADGRVRRVFKRVMTLHNRQGLMP